MDGFNTQISVNINRNRENKSMKYKHEKGNINQK